MSEKEEKYKKIIEEAKEKYKIHYSMAENYKITIETYERKLKECKK